MTTVASPELDPPTPPPPPAPKPSSSPAGGVIYGLGLIGALVWFWRRSHGVKGHALGALKAIVWPAILVHDAFKALQRD